MPYLMIQTNAVLDRETCEGLLRDASRLVSEQLGKPERYVMVAFAPQPHMLFAGDPGPCAYLELKSIHLPEPRTGELSQALCGLMEDNLGVPPERVYIEFANASASLWGWNSGTF
jgi:phenylpyruvate tautomerase